MERVRIALIIATGFFMAYHTRIFIENIEPNVILAWILAIVIEGFLVSLAMEKRVFAKFLLIPLFWVSVLGASSSYLVKERETIEKTIRDSILGVLLTRNVETERAKRDIIRQAIEQARLNNEVWRERANMRELVKSLEKESEIQNKLIGVVEQSRGYLRVVEFAIFFVIVFIVQLVNIYTASGLELEGLMRKKGKEDKEGRGEVEKNEVKEKELREVGLPAFNLISVNNGNGINGIQNGIHKMKGDNMANKVNEVRNEEIKGGVEVVELKEGKKAEDTKIESVNEVKKEVEETKEEVKETKEEVQVGEVIAGEVIAGNEIKEEVTNGRKEQKKSFLNHPKAKEVIEMRKKGATYEQIRNTLKLSGNVVSSILREAKEAGLLAV